jgi:outer membrane receptor for ferrienterochelin and colicins
VKGAASDYDPRRDDTASKTVLNAEEIRKYGDDNIYDVLKRAPGVTVTGKTLRMRGLGAGYTQILVNGDRPPPGFNLDTLTPDQIERIEIIRAASAEFRCRRSPAPSTSC